MTKPHRAEDHNNIFFKTTLPAFSKATAGAEVNLLDASKAAGEKRLRGKTSNSFSSSPRARSSAPATMQVWESGRGGGGDISGARDG